MRPSDGTSRNYALAVLAYFVAFAESPQDLPCGSKFTERAPDRHAHGVTDWRNGGEVDAQ
jgi:hypothetical protein